MCDIIQEKLKDLNYPRYKYVVQVLLGQNVNQGMRSTSRCLWNINTRGPGCLVYDVPDMLPRDAIEGRRPNEK
jgi:hypothetical protein